MEEMATLVTNFGFPIVLSFYLLFRTETKLDILTKTINELTKVITKCNRE